jgi:hypothetical protein
MNIIKMKSYEEFYQKLNTFDTADLANELLTSIKRGITKGNKKVAICDVEIEDEQEIVRLYSSYEDWPVALEGCIKAFVQTEEYEKCTEVQNLLKEYESNKNVSKTPNVEENQINPLIQAINNLSEVISKQPVNVQAPSVETEYVTVENPINDKLVEENNLLKIQLESAKQERDYLFDKIENNNEFIQNEELKDRYIQLLDFAFRNIDPFTNIDILQARGYYENIIKK